MPKPAIQNARARVDECLQRAQIAGPGVRVVPLTGDASTRQYFRALRPDNPRSLSPCDEPADFDTLPFVNVCRLFGHIPLPSRRLQAYAISAS
jgi:hypothetical protein